MNETESAQTKNTDDAPRRVRSGDLKARYKITDRLAGDWLRAMCAANVVRKLRGVFVARWSAIDAWVESGGVTTGRGRRS